MFWFLIYLLIGLIYTLIVTRLNSFSFGAILFAIGFWPVCIVLEVHTIGKEIS